MKGSKRFQVVRNEVPATRLVGEFTITGAFPRGTAFEDSGNGATAVVADLKGCLGFTVTDVTVAGPTFEEKTIQDPNMPVKSGEKVTLELPEPGAEIEVENENGIVFNAAQPADITKGYLLVTNGIGAVAADTVAGTALALKNGRWYQAQTTDTVKGILLQAGLTPQDGATNIRARIRLVDGYIKTA